MALALSFTHTSLKSPFHSPFLHSPCMLLSEFLRRSPPKVTFRRFSEMYLANYVAFCGMSVCVLLILYCFTGPRGSRANPGGHRRFDQKSILFSHRFVEGFFFIFTSFLDHLFNEIPTLSYPFFETYCLMFFQRFL